MKQTIMKLWYYIEKSEQRGPVSKAELIVLLKSGHLPPDALVWTHYMQDWTRASEVEDLRLPASGGPPPAPKSAPAPVQEGWATPHDDYAARPGAQQEAAFFHISGARLVLMSIASWGLFELYWIYRNWQYLKERDGLNIRPFWRGVFSIFFIHKLMNTIHDDPQANRVVKAAFPPSLLATVWVIMMLVGNISGKAQDPGLNLLGLIVSFPSFLIFLPVQNYINAVNRALSPGIPYARWTAGQHACLVVGILIWLFMLAAVLATP